MVKLLRLSFLPTSVDLALLVLRVWLGLALVSLHGWSKLIGFAERSQRFADPFGIGSPASLALAVFAEVVCSVLLVLGLFTRFAALACGITMATAFFFAHGGRLTGQGNGELAFIFLGGFVTLFLAGGGRFSLDGKGGSKR
jgi:putative oxidoreductase